MDEANSGHKFVRCLHCGRTNRIIEHGKSVRAMCGICKNYLNEDYHYESKIVNTKTKNNEDNDYISFFKRYWYSVIALILLIFIAFAMKGTDEYFAQPVQSLPSNGSRVIYFNKRDAIAPLEFVTKSDGTHYYVKICNYQTGTLAATLFIRSGEKVYLEVPIGTYSLRFASGDTWYGTEYYFGPKTVYEEAEEKFIFNTSDDSVKGYNITLYGIIGGNMETKIIKASDF